MQRRVFLSGLAGATSFAGFGSAASTTAAQGLEPIEQPSAPDKASFMARAQHMRELAMRGGDQGFGAVVAKDGRIVGQAPSRVVTARDRTAHAETEAIRDAARRLGTNDLSRAELYATFRPCPMCESAAYWARVSRIYVGSEIADSGPPRLGGFR